MALSLPIHGGDLAAAEARWGKPAEGWLDLSTGINPWPYPLPPVPAEAWTRLPGAAEDRALRQAAGHRFGCPADCVLAAPGTSSLIKALPRLVAPTHVAIVTPTYGEHAAAWNQAGHEVAEVDGLESIGHARVVVAVNPNNPDGRLHAPQTLLALAENLAARGGLLVVDEAFADAHPDLSVAGHLVPGLVVLRSFGKFYGLAGLRLGFILARPEMLAQVAGQLGPWPVSGVALAMGAAALSDDAWARATTARLAEAAQALDRVLIGAGLEVVGGTTLFRLASHPHGAELYDRLGRAGILVRAFAGRPHMLRFGLPDGSLERLARSLG